MCFTSNKIGYSKTGMQCEIVLFYDAEAVLMVEEWSDLLFNFK